jgi:hypothetical protein
VLHTDPGLLERLAEQVPAFGLEMARVLAERRAGGRAVPIPEADAALVAQAGCSTCCPAT